MHGAIWLLGFGVLLGLGVAVPIGPVNAEIARRTLRRGFLAGFSVGAGATSVDVLYAIVTSLAMVQVQQLFDRQGVKLALGIGGGILLIYFAVGAFIGARRAQQRDAFAEGPSRFSWMSFGLRRGFLAGALMNMLNPWIPAFWFGVVPSQIGSMHPNGAADMPATLPLVCAGVALGAISWVASFSGALSLVGMRHRHRWAVAADLAGGVFLAAFAVLGLWRTARAFL